MRSGIYAGEDEHYNVIPLVTYEGKHVYLHGPELGYHLFDSSNFRINGFVAARLDGVDPKDLGTRELASQGIDRSLLSKRRDSADAGVSAAWFGTAGRLELELTADITGTSEGGQANVSYAYPFHLGHWKLTPTLGVTALSKDTANYYYGTLDKEVARGVPDYRPGTSFVPYAGIEIATRFWGHWNFISSLQYRALPNDIQDSPLIDADVSGYGRLLIGISRSF